MVKLELIPAITATSVPITVAQPFTAQAHGTRRGLARSAIRMPSGKKPPSTRPSGTSRTIDTAMRSASGAPSRRENTTRRAVHEQAPRAAPGPASRSGRRSSKREVTRSVSRLPMPVETSSESITTVSE